MRWPARIRQFWTWLPPLFRGLLLFAIFTIVVVNISLRALPWTGRHIPGARLVAADTVLLAVAFDKRIRLCADSWDAMYAAFHHLKKNPGERVYGPVLEQAFKFQYPPASLLVCEAAQPYGERALTALNAVSWVLMWVNAGLVAMILLESCKRHLAPAQYAHQLRGRWILGVLAVVLTVSFYPIARAMVLGQLQVWINAGAAAMVWLAIRSRWAAFGTVTGLVAILKPQLGLMAVWCAVRGRWRGVAAAAIAGGIPALLALVLYGPAVHLDFVRAMSHIAARGEAVGPNQSFNGVANRLFGTTHTLRFDTTRFAEYSPAVHSITVVTTLVLVALGLSWRRGRRTAPRVEDALIAMLAFTMASPVAWEHHYGVLAPIYAWMLPALIRTPVLGRWTLPLLGLSFVLTGHFIRAASLLANTPFEMLRSYVLAGALIVLVLLFRLRARTEGSLQDTADLAGDRARAEWPGLPPGRSDRAPRPLRPAPATSGPPTPDYA